MMSTLMLFTSSPRNAASAARASHAFGPEPRNACRPVTTSHEPEFRYYFVSFRCCKDPAGMKPFVPAQK